MQEEEGTVPTSPIPAIPGDPGPAHAALRVRSRAAPVGVANPQATPLAFRDAAALAVAAPTHTGHAPSSTELSLPLWPRPLRLYATPPPPGPFGSPPWPHPLRAGHAPSSLLASPWCLARGGH